MSVPFLTNRNNILTRSLQIVPVFVLFCLYIALPANAEGADTLNRNCADVDIVYARGSGQKIDVSSEYNRLVSQANLRMPQSMMNIYELGSESYSGYKYRAIDVSDPFSGNPEGAYSSQGYWFDYGDSVREGVNELKSYITARHQRCPNARIVLGGYSQGAQVIGQSLFALSPELRSFIDFVGLMGDPKLYLPEGNGYPLSSACFGNNYSSWRRGSTDCIVHEGSLHKRDPYVPEDMKYKVGSWCVSNDFVCGSSSIVTLNSGHGHYADNNGPIDEAVIESMKRLSKTLPEAKANALDILSPSEKIAPGPDVMLIIDISNFAQTYIIQAKARALQIATDTIAKNGRVGIAVYGSFGTNTYAHANRQQLTTDIDRIKYVLANQANIFGATWPDPSHEIAEVTEDTIRFAQWRTGVKHIVIPLTNSPYPSPVIVSSQRKQPKLQLIDQQSEQPIIIIPFVPDTIFPSFENFTIYGFNFKLINPSNEEDATQQIGSQFSTILTANLRNYDYRSVPGQELRFDASNSYVNNDTILTYEWDFNNDGIYEKITNTPVTQHTYVSNYEGPMVLRVTTSTGVSDTTSASILVKSQWPASTAPKAPLELQVKVTSANRAELIWTPADTLADTWLLRIDDLPVGRVYGTQNYIEVRDLRRENDIKFSIAGMTAQGEIGEETVVILPKDTAQTQLSGGVLSSTGKFLSAAITKKNLASTITPNATRVSPESEDTDEVVKSNTTNTPVFNPILISVASVLGLVVVVLGIITYLKIHKKV